MHWRVPMIGMVFCSGLLAACQDAQQTTEPPPQSLREIVDAIPQGRVNSDSRRHAQQGILLLDAGRFDEATAEFNKGLSRDISNSRLHFLNGLSYNLRALKEDVSVLPLAQQGYELAVQFDPTNWVARYYLGRILIDQKDYTGAREHLAEAVMLHPDEPDLLYSLAVAAYYSRDLETAAATLDRLRQIAPASAKGLEASSIVMASLNEPDLARSYLDQFKGVAKDDQRVRYLSRRIEDWRRFFVQGSNNIQLAQAPPPLEPQAPAPPPFPVPGVTAAPAEQGQPPASTEQAQPPAPGTAPPAPTGVAIAPLEAQPLSGSTLEPPGKDTGAGILTADEQAKADEAATAIAGAGAEQQKMVIVDVVIIRTEEDHTTAKGVNLLNGLTIQFGQSSLATAGFSVLNNSAKTVGTTTQTIVRALNIPSITYSLNIANANSTRNEILARPTLIAMNGLESKFFTGQNVVGVVVGGGTQGATEKVVQDIGVELTVRPRFLDDGRIMLTARAMRTFLTTPDTTSITFTTRIDTSKTNVIANVVMNYGETLILSGLSEKETERIRDGVPLLQDVPLLQYLFSRQTTRDFQKSELILLTPRNPNYVFREAAAEEPGKPLSKRDRVLNELRARYADWFKPYPNWASVFHHMQANKLYREFRTGDVELERWDSLLTRSDRWRQILDFLFY